MNLIPIVNFLLSVAGSIGGFVEDVVEIVVVGVVVVVVAVVVILVVVVDAVVVVVEVVVVVVVVDTVVIVVVVASVVVVVIVVLIVVVSVVVRAVEVEAPMSSSERDEFTIETTKGLNITTGCHNRSRTWVVNCVDFDFGSFIVSHFCLG